MALSAANADKVNRMTPVTQETALGTEVARIGNNLNQLARQANLGLVAVPAEEIERCLTGLNALVARL